jgi:hypothetical protein
MEDTDFEQWAAELYPAPPSAGTAEQDMLARWLPSADAQAHARALLEAEPRADMAVIPMVQPGKVAGVWTTGQEVETVPGVIFLGRNSFEEWRGQVVPSLAWARTAALELARAYLADLPGTVAYVTVGRDGHVAVFED